MIILDGGVMNVSVLTLLVKDVEVDTKTCITVIKKEEEKGLYSNLVCLTLE